MEFEHIRIGASGKAEEPDDGEVVIVAGAAAETSSPSDEGPDPHTPEKSSSNPEDASQSVHADEKGTEKSHGAHAAESEEGYRPTTLEDIDSSRMPKAQIAVIVVAVLGLAAFAAWYIFGI